MNELAPTKKGWSCLIWTVVIITILLLALNFLPQYGLIPVRSNQARGSQNARQIGLLLHAWAAEHDGRYPDHGRDLGTLTSNEVFRELIRDDPKSDESLFGCPGSMFMPDNNIGFAPAYDQALTAGENHWAMVAGLSHTQSPGHYPLIFENTAESSWPPSWLADSAGKPLKGRVYYGGKLIVGFNDGSVELVELKREGQRMRLPVAVLEPPHKEKIPELKILDVMGRGAESYVSYAAGGDDNHRTLPKPGVETEPVASGASVEPLAK